MGGGGGDLVDSDYAPMWPRQDWVCCVAALGPSSKEIVRIAAGVTMTLLIKNKFRFPTYHTKSNWDSRTGKSEINPGRTSSHPVLLRTIHLLLSPWRATRATFLSPHGHSLLTKSPPIHLCTSKKLYNTVSISRKAKSSYTINWYVLEGDS